MAGKFFSMDGGFMTIMTKIFDVIFLNLLWILFSIPVVTIGASTTAMYYTAVKGIRRGRGYVFKNFWHAFKLNFIPATVAWVFVAFVGYLAMFSYMNVGFFANEVLRYAVYFIDVFVGVICAMFAVYVFPLLSRFNMTKKQLFANSLLLSIKHFLPWTLIMVLIFAGTFCLAWYSLFFMPVIPLILPAVSCLLISFPMEKVLKMNTPESEDNPVDEWYLE